MKTQALSVPGSSPRLRGTDYPLPDVPLQTRFIPAPAGNRAGSVPWPSRSAVHPRACGEQPANPWRYPWGYGSSPRLRGTGIPGQAALLGRRFIPAPAGNRSAPSSPHRPPNGSSPRLRGTVHGLQEGSVSGRFIPAPAGNSVPEGVVSPDQHGSSPRLRGTGCGLNWPPDACRFIPAPAGNRIARRAETIIRSVHPRACGEQIRSRYSLPTTGGSSPRLRGTGLPGGPKPSSDRFIPAPAGNRSGPGTRCRRPAVHPRACGEQSAQGAFFEPAPGSSPRLRGTVRHLHVEQSAQRFIPAPAGNSGPRGPQRPPGTVHPRACGEQFFGGPGVYLIAGSSPRLRGTVASALLASR